MGANSATKLYKIVENLEKVLAIELMNAAQAIEFRTEKTSPFLRMILDSYRQEVSFVAEDRYLHKDILNSVKFLRELQIDSDLIY
jgi:histidine ammonia-lyase